MEKMGERGSGLARAPCEKPPFTIAELRKAVPSHCFTKSWLVSFAYLGRDVAMAAGLAVGAWHVAEAAPSHVAWAVVWPAYWVAQGLVLFSLWVIAHECGHTAFTGHAWADSMVGVAVDAVLLVPFFGWKYSHNRHHKNTASVERDEVFVPKTKDEVPLFIIATMANPFTRLIWILATLAVGWTAYFAVNASGRKYEGFASHFYPHSPIFVNTAQKLNVALSELAVLGVAYGLCALGSANGLAWLMKLYGMPYLVLNGVAVLIIYLQHNHPALPHYTDEEWDWLRGALSTVDRDLGVVMNEVMHHLPDTHIAHHLFPGIPHYHAVEATKALKGLLGDYYQFDAAPVHKALWRSFKECVYVVPDQARAGVLWYANKL